MSIVQPLSRTFTDSEIREIFPKPIVIPLRQQFPELGQVAEFKDRLCIFSHDRSVLHGVVSPRYQLVDHGELLIDSLNSIEQIVGKRPSMNISVLNSGGRMRATVHLDDVQPIKVGKDDYSKVQLSFVNSYDGLQRFMGLLGAFRLVCSNGMMIGKKFGGFSTKHFPGVSKQEGLLTERIQALIESSAKLGTLWNKWSQQKVQYDEAKKLLEASFSKKYLTLALAEETFPKTRWELYNEMTFQATHSTRSEARRLEMDQVIADLFYTSATLQALKEESLEAA